MVNYLKEAFEKSKGKSIDFALLFVLIVILCLGIITLSSASSYYALTEYGTSTYYLIRQIIFAIIGIIVMLICSKIDYKIYYKFAYPLYGLGIFMMIAVFLPGIGVTGKGARRWINLGFTTMQPSEIMKIFLIFALSAYMCKNASKFKNLKGYVFPIGLFGLIALIMYFQDHLSGTIVMAFITFVLLIIGGIKLKTKTVVVTALVAIAVVAGFIFSDEYRKERVFGYLNPEEDVQGSNWQPTQSLYAIGSGGLFGKGIGQSRQKYLWLPEAQNDFIFAIYAEEYGFIGVLILLILISYFIIRGVKIGLKCKDKFGMLITVGIMALFAFQFVMNIGVVTKVLPTTGITFPFFSSGGTSLLINLASMGIVLNVSRQESK